MQKEAGNVELNEITNVQVGERPSALHVVHAFHPPIAATTKLHASGFSARTPNSNVTPALEE